LDLTPDVSTAGAIVTEAIEPITGGAFPSHLVYEFPLQLKHDIIRMERFLRIVFLMKESLKDRK